MSVLSLLSGAVLIGLVYGLSFVPIRHAVPA